MPTLSLAMIVKDEAKNLPRCLRSVAPLVDEFRIVDTGSTDDTAAIARSFGAEVIPFPWVDDFAAARNAGLRRCTGDWVLILDADEAIDPRDHGQIRQACAAERFSAYHLVVRNYFLDGGARLMGQPVRPNDDPYEEAAAYSHCADFPLLRLCRNAPDLAFEGRIHEVILPYFERRKLRVGALEARIHHFGKVDLDREAEKRVRYLQLARQQTEEQPRHAQAWFNLLIQAASAEAWGEAIHAAGRFLQLNPHPSPLGLTTVALAYQEGGRAAEAVPLWRRALKAQPGDPQIIGGLARALGLAGHPGEAQGALAQALRTNPRQPALWLGLAEAHLADGQADAAREALRQAITACPEDEPLRDRLIALDLQAGQEQQAVLSAWTALRAIPHGGRGRWHALVAGFLLSQGETAKGRLILEDGLRRFPGQTQLEGLAKTAG